MSGFEHTGTDKASAQITGVSKSDVCTNTQIDFSEKKEFCGTESGPSMVFEPSAGFQVSVVGETGRYSDNVGNWDVEDCLGEGLNATGSVCDVLHMLDTDVQGFGPSGMGNNTLSNGADADAIREVDDVDGGGAAGEQVLACDGPDCGGFIFKPVEDMLDTDVEGFGPSGMGNNTSSNDADVVREVNDVDRGDAAGEQVPVCGGPHGGGFNCKPVEDASKGMIAGIEEMPGSSLGNLEGTKEVPFIDASENFCETVGFGSGAANNHEEAPGESLNAENLENQMIEGADVNSWATICEVAKQSEEYACLMPVIGEYSLPNGSMNHEGGVSTYPHFGYSFSPNKVNGEKQEEFGIQSILGKPLGEEVLQQLQTYSIGDPVQASSKSDHGIVGDSLKNSMDVSNVVAEGTSYDKMTESVKNENALVNMEEVNYPSILIEKLEQVEKAASEAEPSSAGESKDDMIGSSALNNEYRSVAEHMEKSEHVTGKGVDGVEGGGSAASDEKLGPVELSRQSAEGGAKARAVVFGLPVHDASEKPHRGRRPVETSATSGKRPGRTSARTVRTPESASAETRRRPEKRSATTGKRPTRTSVRTVKTPEIASAAKHKRPEKSPLTKGKRPRQAFAGSTRVLRSRVRDESFTPEPSITLENTRGSSGGRRGRKIKSESEGNPHDEFSRMRKHLRYLLHRIGKERNLLEAYSSEGWRGQSLEKLRPEKELERAKKDINRFKLKIRELFQRIESMSAEGRFPDSLYDSDGLIDSEDIYCAKCGSKDLSKGNDILLCDGVCDRGFHQNCLEPPLRSEEIPPGDEGWLCPTCDCKVDCIDLLNDSQGTNLAIEDSWEKVFPEAMATTTGHEQGDMSGFPSDDSEDNDYNPDGPDDNARFEGSEDSSDGSDSDSDSSDFSSASEDLGAVRGDEQNLELPSDDSEDNDYDPDAANVKEEQACRSSSSDFTSDPETLETLGDDASDKGELSIPCDLDEDMGDSVRLSGKRLVERLDYKKLYDETYGDADGDSSDDEEWTGTTRTRTKRNSAQNNVSVSAMVDNLASGDGMVTPQRKSRSELKKSAASGSPSVLERFPQESSSGGKSRKRPPCNRLGEAVTQRLYEAFKEYQYPDRSTKEKLAKELGLTPLRVDKWFGNARWSLRHHPTRMEASIAKVLPQSSSAQTVPRNGTVIASASFGTPLCGSTNSGELNMEESSGRISTRQKSSKRKRIETNEPMLQTSKTENCEVNTQADQFQTPVKRDLSRDNTKALLQTPETEVRRSQRKRKSVD